LTFHHNVIILFGYAFSSAGVAQLAARSQADTHAPPCKNAASCATLVLLSLYIAELKA